MTEPDDRAVLLLRRVGELVRGSRAIAQQPELVPDGESSADAADRIAYRILVAAVEEGLVTTTRHALEVLKRFSHRREALTERVTTLPKITPMQSIEVDQPFHRDGWTYEEKYDGWRMIAYKDGRHVQLISRAVIRHCDRLLAELALVRVRPRGVEAITLHRFGPTAGMRYPMGNSASPRTALPRSRKWPALRSRPHCIHGSR